MRPKSVASSLLVQEVADRIAPHLEELLVRGDTAALRAVLAQWQALACAPGSPEVPAAVRASLAVLAPGKVLAQALRCARYDIVEALCDQDVSPGQVLREQFEGVDLDRLGQDWITPVQSEPFLLAHLAVRQQGDEGPIDLAHLARIDPGRPGCLMAPAGGTSTSWLALALLAGHAEAAERIWDARLAQGGQWSPQERVEAALAWLGSPNHAQHTPKALCLWWDRLLAGDLALAPVAVKPGWVRKIGPASGSNLLDLKDHLEHSLAQVQSGHSPDMLGVLVRALHLAPDPGLKPTLRPVDLLLPLLDSLPVLRPEKGESPQDYQPFMDKVLALDWPGMAPDVLGRPMALAALDASRQGSRRPLRSTLMAQMWRPLIPALADWQKSLWFSQATRMAIEGRDFSLIDAISWFRGLYGTEETGRALVAAANHFDEVVGRVSSGRPKEQYAEGVAVLKQFWSVVAPQMEFASTPEAARAWHELREQALARVGAFDPASPHAPEAFRALAMELRMGFPAPSVPAPRM